METKVGDGKDGHETNTELAHLYSRGMWNSGLLTVMFLLITASNFSAGSYWGVGFGVIATFVCGRDTVDFYKHSKSAKGA